MNKTKAAIVCCSNGQREENKGNIRHLQEILDAKGFDTVLGDYIFQKDSVASGTAIERADSLMRYFKDPTITDIFDISGGDIANEILPHLDYSVISRSKARFWGYSDLTTIINGIYTRTGKASILYQARNLLYKDVVPQDLFSFSYTFLQKDSMEGIVVGGNIRCLLKLAGTDYWPDMDNKILLLESLHGTVPQMITYLNQLKQIGVFERINGILLGTFTQMLEEKCKPTMFELVRRYSGEQIPVAITYEIGHGTDSKAIVIGRSLSL